jgi:subtilase family serine protease
MTPPQVAELYNFPSNLDGRGQCIAIIELGGGFRANDLTAYFKSLGIKKPTVTAVSIGGAHNEPDGPTKDANGEVMLDIEVAGAVAPGAKIAVYFAPNTDEGFLNALSAATTTMYAILRLSRSVGGRPRRVGLIKPSVILIALVPTVQRWALPSRLPQVTTERLTPMTLPRTGRM